MKGFDKDHDMCVRRFSKQSLDRGSFKYSFSKCRGLYVKGTYTQKRAPLEEGKATVVAPEDFTLLSNSQLQSIIGDSSHN